MFSSTSFLRQSCQEERWKSAKKQRKKSLFRFFLAFFTLMDRLQALTPMSGPPFPSFFTSYFPQALVSSRVLLLNSARPAQKKPFFSQKALKAAPSYKKNTLSSVAKSFLRPSKP